MGIYAWHKLLPPTALPPSLYPFLPVTKTKGSATFLLKLPFNHWVIASAVASSSLLPSSELTSFNSFLEFI